MGTRPVPSTPPLRPLRSLVRECRAVLATGIRTVAFWTAVALPWALLALLLTGPALAHPELLVGLFVASVASGILGHNYGK